MNGISSKRVDEQILFQIGRGFFIYLIIFIWPMMLCGEVTSIIEAKHQLNASDPFMLSQNSGPMQLALRAKSSSSDGKIFPFGELNLPLTAFYHVDAAMGYLSQSGVPFSFFMIGIRMHQALNDSSIYTYSVAVQKRYLTTDNERLRRISAIFALDRRFGPINAGTGLELNLEKGSANGYSPDGWLWSTFILVRWKTVEAALRSDGNSLSTTAGIGVAL